MKFFLVLIDGTYDEKYYEYVLKLINYITRRFFYVSLPRQAEKKRDQANNKKMKRKNRRTVTKTIKKLSRQIVHCVRIALYNKTNSP